ELELMVREGLTPTQALEAATSAPAKAFHLDDRGAIAQGKRADLVLLDGDPTTDIKATRKIAAVWEAGVPINRAAWRAGVDKRFEEAEKRKNTPAPAGAEWGWVSDFEGGKADAQVGSWSVSTDGRVGRK